MMKNTFIDDTDKMYDFMKLSKEEFLKSYSYLTEAEYDNTEIYLEWLRSKEEENKQDILNLLAVTLKQTKDLYDLVDLTYDESTEMVKATFQNGVRYANVSCDSGVAMIVDVIRQIR